MDHAPEMAPDAEPVGFPIEARALDEVFAEPCRRSA
jgi:hypothetical protein